MRRVVVLDKMVKFYHGTDEKNDLDNILKTGIISGQHLKKNMQPYVFVNRNKKRASHFGKYLIEINIPKNMVYIGNNDIDWPRDKPVWEKTYDQNDAITRGGIPRRYIKAVIINGVRFKI